MIIVNRIDLPRAVGTPNLVTHAGGRSYETGSGHCTLPRICFGRLVSDQNRAAVT
jgi:hypothetical protein